MNYHQSREKSFLNTLFFTLLFAMVVIITAFLISALVSYAIYFELMDRHLSSQTLASPQFKSIFLGSAAIVSAMMILAALIQLARIRHGGGPAIANMMGAKHLTDEHDNIAYKQYRNIVEEMAIASGMPVPHIFILDSEMKINAFVAGYTPSDTAIAVTKGSLKYLNRNELQGVIGHEFSHIKNGDMKLNTNITCWLTVIMGVFNLGIFIIRNSTNKYGSSRRHEKASLYGLALVIIGSVGLLFGTLARAAVNREREYFADISAVRLNRDNSGITGALIKIASLDTIPQPGNIMLTTYSHMMFTDAISGFNLTSTHPPILKRIRKLNPRFNHRDVAILREKWKKEPPQGLFVEDNTNTEPNNDNKLAAAILGSMIAGQSMAEMKANTGTVNRGEEILNTIPEKLQVAARNQFSAPLLIFSLVLDKENGEIFKKQIELLREIYNEKNAEITREFYRLTRNLPINLSLPLAELAHPSISRLSEDKRSQVITALDTLIAADNKIDIFEYCLSHTLKKHLQQSINPCNIKTDGNSSISDITNSIQTLLTVLAQSDTTSDKSAEELYYAGMQHLMQDNIPPYQPERLPPTALDPIWPDLESLTQMEKTRLSTAMILIIKHDSHISHNERELVRVICSSINYPLPIEQHPYI